MTREESVWTRKILREADLSSVNDVLDIGSSTKEFRTVKQPYIDGNVFEPLRERSISISYMDKKNGEGIDLVYDIENVSADDIGKQFDLVICCNLLEHVHNPRKLASLLVNLVRKNGFLLVTVPQTFRFHPDPIDTMFRPSMMEFVSIFPGLQVVRKTIIRVRDWRKYSPLEFFRYIIPSLNWKINCLFMEKGEP
ncbi:MAG: class I SAM-dependent methyltransferase [Promethearchaeota archaeon]|jgi:2-polyprenyl-3-methyl-5-hydroxy-6-metoxy-1,4-benzoquinol methylase